MLQRSGAVLCWLFCGVLLSILSGCGGSSSSVQAAQAKPAAIQLDSISPTSVLVATPFTMILTGSGFTAASSVFLTFTSGSYCNGNNYCNPTQISYDPVTGNLTASFPAISAPGTGQVTVVNAVPISSSNSLPFTVTPNPVPSITSLSPSSATAGDPTLTLTVSGSNFITGSVVQWNGSNRPTTYGSGTQLTAVISQTDLTTAGSANVTVVNPAPGGGTSAPATFTVNGRNPAPTITSVSSSTTGGSYEIAGDADFTLTVNGTGFISGSTILWNGSPRTNGFNYVSATQITATISAADIVTAGNASITVSNPAPGGGTSGHLTFTIYNPAPANLSLSPASATFGGPAFTLTVSGTGFVTNSPSGQSSTVNWNGSARTTTFISGTQLTASISANDISSVSSAINVTVVNPGGTCGSPPSAPACTSAAAQFTVGNPVPTITSFSPPSATAYTSAFTLTVNGAGFVQGAVINWNGTALTTAVVNGSCSKGLCTQLQANITASQIAVGANISITVTNPTPGGGTSAPSTFVVSNPQPVVSALSQSSVIAGAAGFNLTVTGSGFVPNASTVQFNGSNLTPTTVNSAGTSLTVAIPASSVATPAATFDVTVTNPAPGGGISAVVAGDKFTIYNPTITALSPNAVGAGSADFPLTITGSSFVTGSPGATVQFGTTNLTVTSLTSTQIVATVTASLVTSPGTINVTVTDPAPSGGTSAVSAPFTFTVNAGPSISSLSPSNAGAGAPAFTLTVNGSNFVSGATVQWNGNPRTTTFVNNSQLTAAISAGDVASAGAVTVKVVNPDGGSSTASTGSTFTVNAGPAISSLSPNNVGAGASAFTLTVNGSNFVSGATVQWNGNNRTTNFVSSSQLTAAIAAGDVASAGTIPIKVVNPDGGTSAASNFKVNPGPAISSLSPNSVGAGAAGFTLTVNGSNFVSGSTVQWNGNSRTTTYVNSGKITAAISASDVAASGTIPVTVVNPDGGTSAASNFTVNGGPTISSLSPNNVGAGTGALTLTVNGSNFVSGATVQWNGNNRTTTFANNSQLTAAISASDVASAGTASVTVVNPDSGTSAASTFTINPDPAISSLSPANIGAGSGDFTLTVNGSNFVSSATVQWNGNNRATTFVNSSQLTAAISAGDVASPGTAAVTVLNPDGGISSSATFTVNNPAPTITSLSPGWVLLGSDAFTLTVAGTNFVSASTVSFNGNTLTGASVNGAGTSLAVTVPRTAIASAGAALSVSVTNPSPGGGSSGSLTFFVVGVSAMASVATDGIQGDGDSQFGVISPDGRFVAFASDASTLVSDATNGKRNVYLRDTCPAGATGCSGPSTILVSVSDSPAGPNDDSSPLPDEIAMTSDGRFIAFASNASNLVAGDANSVKDVFLRDTCNGASGCTASTTLISVAAGGAQSNQPSSGPAISTNGQYVAFISYSDNTGTPNPLVVSPPNGYGVYLRDTVNSTTVLVSASSQNAPDITSDGRYVAYDDGTNVYIQDATCLATSCAPALVSVGTKPSLNSTGQYVAFITQVSGQNIVRVMCIGTGCPVPSIDVAGSSGVAGRPSISSDGRFVAFSSATMTFVSDTCMGVPSGCTPSATPMTVSIGQNGVQVPPTSVYSSRYAITLGGHFVAFDAPDALLSIDTNNKRDVFIAITGF